jgi:tRNA threonylcarbamoyl adenosine modification protein (Sua5/YciO/YrdC/YwlC family)
VIQYVQPHNPDDRVVRRAAEILNNGGIVAYPTDSSWGIGCSIESSQGFEKLSKLRADRKMKFSLICSEIGQISTYAHMDTRMFKQIKKHTPGPFVFIIRTVHKVEKKVGIKRPEIGFRIPDHQVPVRIVQELGHPMFSITAARDMSDVYSLEDAYAEELLFDFGWELEDIPEIDLVIDSGEELERRLSTVIELEENDFHLLREGKGIWMP